MVQLKYYGDDRDYFKYDLISFVLKESRFNRYGFVPMLTEHRQDNEGNIAPTPSGCKSQDLLRFICSHPKPDLNNWELWLKNKTETYATVQPVNSTYIGNHNRNEYWSKFDHVISAHESLVFFDPDTGVQAGRKTKIVQSDFEKYILNNEMPSLLTKLSDTSVFVIYQHLQRNIKKHEFDIERKIDALVSMNVNIKISAYREKDLAFLFLVKSDVIHESIKLAIEKYNHRSSVIPRSFHYS